MDKHPSLISELQEIASSNKTDMDEVLRKAYLAAAKLEQSQFMCWLQKEIDGYGKSDEIPNYRQIRGTLVYRNPYRGECPIFFEDSSQMDVFCLHPVQQPLSEIICLIRRENKKGAFMIDFPPEVQKLFWDQMSLPMRCYLRVDFSPLERLVEAVRQRILEWSVELEKAGIRGDGMSFTSEEVQTAKSITVYNINHSQGIVVGNVQGQTVEIRGYSSIHSELEKAGVSKEARRELEDLMEAHAKANPEEKPNIAKQGIDWIMQNADKLAALSSLLREWFRT